MTTEADDRLEDETTADGLEDVSPTDRFADGYRWGVYRALSWAARQPYQTLRGSCELAQAALLARALRIEGTIPPRQLLDEIDARLAATDGPTTTRRRAPKGRGARSQGRAV